MTFGPHDLVPRSLRPSAIAKRANMVARRTVTMADLADVLAALHGDARMVTESVPGRRDRTLTYVAAARQVARWSAAVAARSQPGQPVV
ncbi:MAG: hypothetical protein ACKOYM_11000, partial [Actinomycetes bacterium]